MTTNSIVSIYPALTIIDNFASASGLGINRAKSCVVSNLNANSEANALLAASPWPSLRISESTTYLGIPIGAEITLDDIWAPAFTKAHVRIRRSKHFIKSLSVSHRIIYFNTFIASLFSYVSLFFVLPSEIWDSFRAEIKDVLIPFNNGAYTYDTLISARHLFQVKPLKDIWAQGVALLAARSSLIQATCHYDDLPDYHAEMTTSKLIWMHRDAAAVDFWRGAHTDGTLVHSKPPTSSNIYNSIIADVFLDKTRKHFSKRISDNFTRYSHRPDFVPSPIPSSSTILDNLQKAHSLPNHVLYHHMSLCLNALSTSSRMRFFKHGTVESCTFCGDEEDSLYHIYARCTTVTAARCLFLSNFPSSFSKCDIPHPHPPDALNLCPYANFPLSHTLLSSTSNELLLPVLIFNFAIWKYRLPAAAARPEKGPHWVATHIASIGNNLSAPKKSMPDYKNNHESFLSGVPDDTIVCYTDGSASPNPGP